MKRIKEKQERALGVKLFLKAERCNSPKCALVRRPYRPGMHGKRRSKVTEYGKQLKEKQKIRLYYGLSNRQMSNLFQEPSRQKIITTLEQRLDRVVFLLGFARSPRVARQFVSHGHILVNGKKVTIPSFHVRVGDGVAVRPESKKLKVFENIHARLEQYAPPVWLKLNAAELKGACVKESVAEESYQFPFDINLVGQFYTR